MHVDGPRARYNLGNALAQNGQYQEALDAYDAKPSPWKSKIDHADAIHNRELVAKLLEQQQEQEQDPEQEQEPQEDQSSDPNEESQGDSEESPPSSSQESEPQEGSSSDETRTPQSAARRIRPASGNETQQAQASEGQKDPGPEQQQASASNSEAGRKRPKPRLSKEDRSDPTQTASNQAIKRHSEPARKPEPADAGVRRSLLIRTGIGSESKMRSQAREANSQIKPMHRAMKMGARGQTQQETGQKGPLEEETFREAPTSARSPIPAQVPMSEQEQEVEQWLSRVPDDPGGLLREKLRRRYAEKNRA